MRTKGSQFGILFQEDYNHQSVDAKELIPQLEGELAEVRCALMDGVQKLIDRGQRLEELVRKTQSLQIKVNDLAHFYPSPLSLSFY